MTLTREQIQELKEWKRLFDLGMLSQMDFAEKLLDHAPVLIETAEWARETLEAIVQNKLIVDQRKKRRYR